MPTRPRRAAALVGAVLLAAGVAACGDDDDVPTATEDAVVDPADGRVAEGAGGPAAGACLEGSTDCEDAVTDPDAPVSSPAGGGAVEPPTGEDAAPSAEAARQRARDLLGTPEDELDADVRVGRRGDEEFMLTEDYVLGRITVELDEVGGRFIATRSTVELPDGPETFTLDGG